MTIEQTTLLDPSPFATNDEWLAQYIFGSFYFSQGGIDLQSKIDAYGVGNFRPNFESGQIWDGNGPESLGRPLLKATADIISTYISGGKHFEVSRPAIEVNILSRFNSIGEQVLRVSGDESEERPKKLVEVILDNMHSRETRFLNFSAESSRRMLVGASRELPTHPRFATSILLAHLVNGKDARHPVFTQMFADMKEVVVAEPEYNFARLQRLEVAVAELQSRAPRDVSAIFQP